MQTDADKHFFTHRVAAIQSTFTKPPYINIKILVGVLPSMAKFGKCVSCLDVEKLIVRQKTRCVQLRTVPGFRLGICSIS